MSIWIAGAALLLVALAQQGHEGTRILWDTSVRPASKAPKPAARPIRYKPAPAPPAPVAVIPGLTQASATSRPEVLGLTFWRLRRASALDDPNTRLLILDEDSKDEIAYIPERVEADTPLAEGDRVRVTVEVPRTGYLYVFDREQYGDGKTSQPYLIYPNYLTRQGDNAVAAGRLIEIPDQRDRPNHFRVRKSRPDQVSELLSVMITPEPLPNLRVGRDPMPVREEQMAEWENKFHVQAERWEMEGGAGKAWTPAEKAAGADPATLLTRDDPAPQTLYRVAAEPGKPMLLKVPIKLDATARK
ncbi:MAG: DUF4384 domain-containing protein [Acidobacteria bacterium]|nr:DUF4384 domain-containing protein [Acidobacteriota bacterium]